MARTGALPRLRGVGRTVFKAERRAEQRPMVGGLVGGRKVVCLELREQGPGEGLEVRPSRRSTQVPEQAGTRLILYPNSNGKPLKSVSSG